MSPRRAAIVGTGLIGGSIGLALRRRGWHVTGDDREPAVAARAPELGALEQDGIDGADPDLFAGAVWVLTRTAATDDRSLTTLRTVIGELGADVVSLAP